MPKIQLETRIEAPVERVFDLARSVGMHVRSTASTNERAIAGKTHGLMGLHDEVTWRARHFGVWQELTVKITEYEHNKYFVDEMQRGVFSSFRHEHRFETLSNQQTMMTDVFNYKSPLGTLGKLADFLFLERYMTRFLYTRNEVIRHVAEGDDWMEILK